MKSIVAAMLTMLVAFASVSCTSAELCPSTDQNRAWSSACFEGAGSARHVKPENTKKIIANMAGFATIMIDETRELVAVDRSGAVRISNIFHTGDFDFPNANQGLGRFQKMADNGNGEARTKCGYFNGSNFTIAVPATYDQCLAFKEGTATVCNDCAKYCTEPECQNSILVGGRGFIIDGKNKVLHQFAPPSLDKACGDKQSGKVVKVTETISYLQCSPAANSPFGQLR